jgi:hypothetical protein
MGRRAVALAAIALGLSPVLLAHAQAPPRVRPAAPAVEPPKPEENPLAPPPEQVGDVTNRYKLIERYTPEPTKDQPEVIGQFRVALRDVARIVEEKPQGAPDRKESSVQLIFSERPAALNNTGAVTDSIRRYETFRFSQPETKPAEKARARPPLEGLTVWNKARSGGPPLMIALTPGRTLTQTEFDINARTVNMPDLVGVLPALPSRVGDRWRIPPAASAVLLGDRPVGGGPLVGTLVDVRKAEKGTDLVAVIGVSGRALMPPNGADHLLNAQVLFTFSPPQAGSPTTIVPTAPANGVIDARGAITEVRLAKSSTSAVAPNSRLRRILTHELTLQRQFKTSSDPIALPKDAPVPSEANSWLTIDDPLGHFHFRHPQTLLFNPQPAKEGGVDLIAMGAPGEGFDKVLSVVYQAPTGDQAKDRENRDPEFHLKELTQTWADQRRDVIRGPRGWLPDAEWAPNKMRVYRIEAAFKTGGTSAPKDSQRIFFDYYLILTNRNESLVATSMTVQDPPIKFRNEVEDILHTIQPGPSTTPEG